MSLIMRNSGNIFIFFDEDKFLFHLNMFQTIKNHNFTSIVANGQF